MLGALFCSLRRPERLLLNSSGVARMQESKLAITIMVPKSMIREILVMSSSVWVCVDAFDL